MKNTQFRLVLAMGLSVGWAAIISGCSKEEEAPPVPVSPEQPAAAATAPQPVQPTPAPTVDPNLQARQQAEAQAALAAAEAALRQREYEKAVQAMLTVQRQAKLTEQQAQAARNNMVKLQSDLANALASGDPKAKAAAEMLRRSGMR